MYQDLPGITIPELSRQPASCSSELPVLLRDKEENAGDTVFLKAFMLLLMGQTETRLSLNNAGL